ncbi:MAG: RICIN domain-containing protein [Actinomycetota bacterium]
MFNRTTSRSAHETRVASRRGTRWIVRRLLLTVALVGATLGITPAPTAQAITSGTVLVGNGGNCLDVPFANRTNGTNLWMWQCNGTNAQRVFIRNGRIEIMQSGKCLDIEGPSTRSGTPVQIWDCQNVPQHRWTVRADGSIYSSYARKCLDVSGGSTAARAKVQIWSCNGTKAQQWYSYDSRYSTTYGERLYSHTYQLGLSANETVRVNNLFKTDPGQFFPFRLDRTRCLDCGRVLGVGNILKLEGQYAIGDVMVVDSHSTGWKFLALPGHIAQGGTVEFTLVHSSSTYDPNDRGAFLTVTAYGRGGLEASSPTFFVSSVGRATWSKMAAAINCWDLKQSNPNAAC